MRKTKTILVKSLAIAAALAFGADAYSQGCITNGANGTITNLTGGTIQFVEDNGYFDNEAPIANIQNSGTIQFSANSHTLGGTNALGSTAALTIPGTVEFNAGVAQTILDKYYTNLLLSNTGPKTYAAGTNTYVAGTYEVGGGARTYAATSTFTYNGSAPGTQTILGENGYADLVFENDGPKQLNDGTTAVVNGNSYAAASNTGTLTLAGTYTANGTFTQDNASGDVTIDNNGSLTLNDAANQSDFAGNVNLTNGGDIDVAAAGGATFGGDVTVTAGDFTVSGGTAEVTGTLALADAATAVVDVAAGQTLDMAGTFTNARDERDNMTFASTSTVIYSGTNDPQNVVSASSTNPYGNLTLSGGNKANAVGDGTESNVNIAGNFSLSGGDFTVDTDNTNDGSDARSLVMLASTATVTYNADEEVIGGFRYTDDVAFTSGTTYTFNNANAQMSWTEGAGTVPGNTQDGYIELRSYPGVAPRNYDNTTDANHLYQLWYNVTDWSDLTLRLSWDDTAEGTWASTAGQEATTVRLWESDDDGIEKIVTGQSNAYTRNEDGAGLQHWAQIFGIDPSTSDVQNTDGTPEPDFFSSNDFVLRSGPTTFYTISKGRWSNPLTWDEGAEPGSNDEAVILHTVHAGYTRPSDSYATAEATPANLATKITVDDTPGNGASLLLGGNGTFGLTGNDADFEILTIGGALSTPADATLTGGANDNADVNYNGGVFVFAGTSFNVTGCLINDNGNPKNAGTLTIGGDN